MTFDSRAPRRVVRIGRRLCARDVCTIAVLRAASSARPDRNIRARMIYEICAVKRSAAMFGAQSIGGLLVMGWERINLGASRGVDEIIAIEEFISVELLDIEDSISGVL